MPEGDTIFRSARALGRALGGKTITAFRSTYPLLTRYHDDTPLTGQSVEDVESRGKWLLMHFSGGATLATHMLMSGSWHIYRPGERWQKPPRTARIVIENREYHAIGFNVPVAEMHTAQSLARDPRFPVPKSDLLSGEFDAEAAVMRVRSQADEEIGDVLLHQRVLAGVGNVFKSEVCFVTGLNPFRKVRTLSEAQVREAIAISRKQLRANVMEDSGDTIVTWRGAGRRTTHQSDPTESLWVYGRNREPCRKCGERIRRRLQGFDARVTFWCPQCQPMPDGTDVDG
ncbi:MAG TPA: DNA-formamidopyrimidine glycosylase family protein [Terracidiphilus sp.]|jgi:endonuclease-8|nr:DNA-formamidopyrimidine glycosylase family protein [Terracidiphilus sp.]